jgi:hypothetical protein
MAAPEGFSDKVAFVWKVADRFCGRFTRDEMPRSLMRAQMNASRRRVRRAHGWLRRR